MLVESLDKQSKLTIHFLSCALLLIFSTTASATTTSGITYHGRILNPDNTPVVDSNTQFKIQIRTPDSQNCLMYEEVQAKDLSVSAGAFSITINDGSGSRTDTSGYALDKIFGNYGSFTFSVATCTVGPGTWAPNPADGRSFAVQFKTSTMSSWEPMRSQAVNFVPMAIEAKQVAGFPGASLFRVENGSGPQTVTSLSPSQATVLLNLAQGTTQYVTTTANGATLPAFASDPSSPVAGDVWYDSTNKVVKYYDGTTVQVVGSGGAVSGNSITSGTIGGSTSMNTSGSVTAASVSSTTDSTQNLQIYNTGNTHKVTVTVPASLAADYPLQLPGALPATNGLVLSSTTAGVTSWAQAYLNGGNSWAGPATLGTNDNNTLAFKTNGTNAMVIDTSGNVGIGTTAPVALLHESSGAGHTWYALDETSNNVRMLIGAGGPGMSGANFTGSNVGTFSNHPMLLSAANGSGAKIFLDVNGNVGIGTITPAVPLDVNGTISAASGSNTNPGYIFSGSPGTGLYSAAPDTLDIAVAGSQKFFMNGVGYVFWGSGDFHYGSGIPYAPSGAGIVGGDPWANASNDTPADGASSVIRGAVRNTALTNQNYYFGGFSNSTGFTPTIVMGQQTGANSYNERLRIDPSGNVGIGTTTPAGNLAVDNTGHTATICLNGGCVSTLAAGGGGGSSAASQIFNSNSDGTGSDGGFNFQSNGSNLMTIANNGDSVFTSTTASTSSTTGAVKIGGGLGVAGDIFAGATLNAGTALNINGANGLRFPANDTTFGNSVAIGPNALKYQDALASADYQNIAIGNNALASPAMAATAFGNIAIGQNNLLSVTTGNSNIAIGGYSVQRRTTTGAGNIGLGWGTLEYVTTTSGNIAIGNQAQYNATGFNNVGLGGGDLFNATGNSNVALGVGAGSDVTGGSNNILIGGSWTGGTGVTTGSNNILMGYDVRPPSQTANNQLNIGNLIYATGLGQGTIAGTGNVGIGTTTPLAALHVAGNKHDPEASPSNYGAIVTNYSIGDDNGLWVKAGYFTSTSAVIAQFSSYAGAGSTADRMTIMSNGNVGIGTTAPTTALEVNGNIVEGSGNSTSTTLSSAALATDTTINVASTAGYPMSGMLQIESEIMTYTGTTATTFTGLTRGAMYTTAAAHAGGYVKQLEFGMKSDAAAGGPAMRVFADGSASIGANGTAASGRWAIAMGNGALATGDRAVAIGYGNTATTWHSSALGVNSTSSGWGSFTAGFSNTASANFSFTANNTTTAPAVSQSTFGAFNKVSGTEDPNNWIATDPLFVIGNGTSAAATSNAVTVLKNGNVGIGTTTPAGNLAIDNAGHNAILCLNGTCSTTLGGGGAQASNSNFVFNSNSDSTGTDGGFNFQSAGSNILQISNSGAITTYGNITGNSALAVAAGGTNQNLALLSSGTGAVNIGTGNGTGFSVLDPGGASSNYVTVKGAASGSAPVIGTAGVDTNINLILTPKGTGNVGIGTTSPSAPLNINAGAGYLFRADSAGSNYISFATNGFNFQIAPVSIAQSNSTAYATSSAAAVSPSMNGLTIGNGFSSTNTNLTGILLQPSSSGGVQNAYIGAVSPTSGNTPAIVLGQQTGATAYSEKMRIDTNGNVGIGTTNPGSKLDVSGNINASASMSIGGTPLQNFSIIADNSPASGFHPWTWMQRSQSATANGVAIGYWANGTTDTSGAISSISTTGDLLLATSVGGTYTDRLHITNAGNVGIGTTNPVAPLTIGPGPAPTEVQTLAITENGSAGLRIVDGTDSVQAEFDSWAGGVNIGSFTNSPVTISQNDNTVIMIDTNARVGIGTTSPATALDVNGSVTMRQGYFESTGALGSLSCGASNISGFTTNIYTLTACASGTTTLNIPTLSGWPSGNMTWTVTFYVTGQASSVFNVTYNSATTNVFWDKNSTGSTGGNNYAGFTVPSGHTDVIQCSVVNTASANVYCGVAAQY